MTELETLRRAKMYIDSLARGIDPISGEVADEDSVINNVRVSRCLFYVSDVLDKVIANGGEVGTKRSYVAQIPFNITDKQIARVYISQEPIGISEFSKRVGAVLDEGMKNIAMTHITAWLCENGYLREETVNNQSRKVATAKGQGLGITTIEAVNKQGFPYKKNVYSAQAQSFLLSNIMEIAEYFRK